MQTNQEQKLNELLKSIAGSKNDFLKLADGELATIFGGGMYNFYFFKLLNR